MAEPIQLPEIVVTPDEEPPPKGKPQERGSGTGNTVGRVKGQPPASAKPASESNPPQTWGDWAKGMAWEGLKFVPVAGAIPSGIDAYSAYQQGDYMGALTELAGVVPVGKAVGTAGKLGRWALKGERTAVKEVEKEAVKAAEKKAGGKVRKGPCDHLKKGNKDGKGPHRGGSYGGTKAPGIESHHMPADSVSPLARSQGPAIQMHPADHALTSSHGIWGADGASYRAGIQDMINQGNWRGAMAAEVRDVRGAAQQIGDPTKYNEAMLEQLKYFKCLEKHGLLK